MSRCGGYIERQKVNLEIKLEFHYTIVSMIFLQAATDVLMAFNFRGLSGLHGRNKPAADTAADERRDQSIATDSPDVTTSNVPIQSLPEVTAASE